MLGKRLVARASRTTSQYGTKANTGKGRSQEHRVPPVNMARRPIRAKVGCESIADHQSIWHKGQYGQRKVARASRTTSQYGTKANTGKGWSREHRGPPVNMAQRLIRAKVGRESIVDHQSIWHKGQYFGESIAEPPVIMGKRLVRRALRNHRSS